MMSALVVRFDAFWDSFAESAYLDNNFSGGPKNELLIIVVYLLAVLKIIPGFMARRKQFDLEKILHYYNAFNIIANFLLCGFALYASNMASRCLSCETGNALDYYCVHFYHILKVR